MKLSNPKRLVGPSLMLLAIAALTAGAQAEILRISNGGCDSCESGCSDCCTTCPNCNSYCKLEVSQGKESKSCFKPECKTICIPKIRFPWQSCCEPRCGKTKTVKVLKKHSYECPKCEYKWTIVDCGSGCCTDGAMAPAPTPIDVAPQADAPTPPAASYRYFSDSEIR